MNAIRLRDERIAELESINTELQRENSLLREALAIKNELNAMKEVRRRSRSNGKMSGSALVGTPIRLPVAQPNLDDWYNDVDVSVSSTGSDIRRRLQETLDIRPSQFTSTPLYTHITPPSGQMDHRQQQDRTLLQQSFTEDSRHYYYPKSSSFAANETMFTNMMNETIHKLPPLFKSPLATAPNTPMFSAWKIPEPVLFGLAASRGAPTYN